MDQWLNAAAYGVGLAVAAWAAARPRLLDAAWRGRIWGAALLGLAVLLVLPALGAMSMLPPADAQPEIAKPAIPWHGGPVMPGRGGPGLLTVPALPIPAVVLFAMWAGVASWRVAALALAVKRIRAARGASRPIPESCLERLPEWTAANSGRFLLVLSDRVPAPSMLGFGRPMVAVPAAWLDHVSDEALDAILLHELAHAERRDDLFDLGQQLLLAACWFHPAAWWMASRIAFEREAACDQRAARLTTRKRYARCLVTIAEAMRGGRVPRRALVASSAVRRRQVTRRVERLLADDVSGRLPRSSYPAAPVLAAIVAVVAAAPVLPPVFQVVSAEARLPQGQPGTVESTSGGARLEPGAARLVNPVARRVTGVRATTARRLRATPGETPRATARAEEFRLERDTSAATVESTARTSPHQVPLISRDWSGHLAPSATPSQRGTAQGDVDGATGASAPFRALGSAFSRAGATTGRWFSGAGASVASAVVFK